MAGIGFRLHKLVEGESYTRSAAAYISSAVITSGPWLSSVLSLGLLGSSRLAFGGGADFPLLAATITYAFGLSLILTSGMQMIITRYLADRLYVEDRDALGPACNGVLLLIVPLLFLTVPFILFAPFEWRYRLLSATLFVTLSLTWMISTFLSATRYYANIVVIFFTGNALSLGAALLGGSRYGLVGGLAGYSLGQVVGMVLFAMHIYQEFVPAERINLDFLAYARQYWDLLLFGLLYALGIWADNLLYWHAPGSIVVGGFYHMYPAYDTTKLLAYLSTIPAAAVFLVHVETRFFRHYKAFYSLVMGKGTLAQIREAKRGMMDAARSGLANICMVQFVVVGALFLLAPEVVALAGFPADRVALFRLDLLAANAQFIMLATLLIILYLDARRTALGIAALFVACNFGVTHLTIVAGHVEGGGYLLAGTVGAAVAIIALRNRLRRLEYLTFMLQPMASAR